MTARHIELHQRHSSFPDPFARFAEEQDAGARMLLWRGEDDWVLGRGCAWQASTSGPGRQLLAAVAAQRLLDSCDHAPPLLITSSLNDRPLTCPSWPAPWSHHTHVRLPQQTWQRSGDTLTTYQCHSDEDVAPLAAAQPWEALHHRDFAEQVEDLLPLLQAGAMRKVVLARGVDHQHRRGLSEILTALRHSHSPGNTIYALDIDRETCFVGSSPEQLFTLDGERCRTMALAGSRPRGATPDADQALAEDLLSATKDRKEHQLVVEHLRDALRPRARDALVVPAHPNLRRLPRIQHLETPLDCQLQEPHPFDLLAALHPTPAVCGLPVASAASYLRRHEGLCRGLYSGCLGWMAAGRAAMTVALRGALVRPNIARCYAGAGIVESSDPMSEAAETDIKMVSIADALGLLDPMPPRA